MPAEIWGTFAVNDHCASNAFAREVLLFDRLVLPYPADERERARWRQPNPMNPDESWQPDRLDELLKILGSQKRPADKGGALAWEAPWNEYKWQFERSRSEVADNIARIDAFYSTRMILAWDEQLPRVVEAVAAFPSSESCRNELLPLDERPDNATGSRALLALATPLLVPSGQEGKTFGPLRAAAELARDDDFRQARAAYYEFVRSFLEPLEEDHNARLEQVEVDPSSLELARDRLNELVTAQRKILGAEEQRKRWKEIQYAVTIVALAANVALALINPLAWVGVGAQVAGFVGWALGERAAPLPQSRPLTGGSMFLTVERRLGWGGGPPRQWWERLAGRL